MHRQIVTAKIICTTDILLQITSESAGVSSTLCMTVHQPENIITSALGWTCANADEHHEPARNFRDHLVVD